MLNLNQKEVKFVLAYVKTGVGSASAIEAGYSRATAPQAASRLLKMHKIIEGLALAKSNPGHESLRVYSQVPTVAIQQQVAAEKETGQEKHDTQAKAFVQALKTVSADLKTDKSSPELYLEALMLDEKCEPRLRFEAAKALLPYRSQRLAEAGKKQEKEEAAKIAGKGKFAATATPPLLKSVK